MNFLDNPVPENWDQMDVIKRRMFLSGGMHVEREAALCRDKICAVEIWTECFGGDPKYMKRSDSMEINNILAAWKMAADKDTTEFWTIWPAERVHKTSYIVPKKFVDSL